jgi:CheY-like chemotaxis protein
MFAEPFATPEYLTKPISPAALRNAIERHAI